MAHISYRCIGCGDRMSGSTQDVHGNSIQLPEFCYSCERTLSPEEKREIKRKRTEKAAAESAKLRQRDEAERKDREALRKQQSRQRRLRLRAWLIGLVAIAGGGVLIYLVARRG